jgi:stage III sporulation protein AH
MKKFKKSEIAIYAVALMLVAAGYFNYSTFENKTEETYSEDIVNNIDEKSANVGDAVLVSSNEIENNENNTNNSSENVVQEEKKENVNETEETSSNETNEEDYYANAKLERDKMYAEMISNYEKILNNSNSSEAQKSIVAQEITKINNTKNAIMICENLISTKGFENCVILANDSSINVVVKVKDGLDKEKVAKIQNIISRELNTEIENIHITEK